MGNKKPESASEMVAALNEFLLGEEPDFKNMPPGKVAAYLEKRSLNPSRVFKAAREALASARGQQELAKAREKRERMHDRLPTPRKALGLREALLRQIESLAGVGRAEVYARKFEEAPDEDLRSLVEDFELLEELDFSDDED